MSIKPQEIMLFPCETNSNLAFAKARLLRTVLFATTVSIFLLLITIVSVMFENAIARDAPPSTESVATKP